MIVFFDIDGTLVSDDEKHTVPESAKRAIECARKNGHLMYINTGRTMNNVDMYIREIGFDGYICGCGTYVESGGEVLFYHTMPREKCLEMANIMKECDMAPVYERCDSFFYDRSLRSIGGLDELIVILEKEGKDFSRDVTDADFSFDKLVAWYDEKSDLEKFKKAIAADYDFIDRGYGFCELAVKGYSKASGMLEVCAHHGEKIDNTIAIGDSLNDLPMLLATPHSVVMGGSIKELCSAAEFVTTKLWDDGIVNALKHYNII